MEEDSKERNNSAIKRPRAAASTSESFLVSRDNEIQRIIENILCLQAFSLNVFKFDLYLLKQSILKAFTFKLLFLCDVFHCCKR